MSLRWVCDPKQLLYQQTNFVECVIQTTSYTKRPTSLSVPTKIKLCFGGSYPNWNLSDSMSFGPICSRLTSGFPERYQLLLRFQRLATSVCHALGRVSLFRRLTFCYSQNPEFFILFFLFLNLPFSTQLVLKLCFYFLTCITVRDLVLNLFFCCLTCLQL